MKMKCSNCGFDIKDFEKGRASFPMAKFGKKFFMYECPKCDHIITFTVPDKKVKRKKV